MSVFLELNDHTENMIGLICKTHGLADPLSLAAVSLVRKNYCDLSSEVIRSLPLTQILRGLILSIELEQ